MSAQVASRSVGGLAEAGGGGEVEKDTLTGDGLRGASPRRGLLLRPLPKLVPGGRETQGSRPGSREASPAKSVSTGGAESSRALPQSPDARTPFERDADRLDVVAERDSA